MKGVVVKQEKKKETGMEVKKGGKIVKKEGEKKSQNMFDIFNHV